MVGSIVLTVVAIGLVGFLALTVWWIVDAFLLNKWLKEETSTVAGAVSPPTASESTSQAALVSFAANGDHSSIDPGAMR